MPSPASELGRSVRVVLAALLVVVVGAGITPGVAGAVEPDGVVEPGVDAGAVIEGATVLRPVAPCRLFDSRNTPDTGRLDADTWRVQVRGRCGVPDDAAAVAVSLVATNTTAEGFLTVWPGSDARPTVSNLNFIRGNTVANSAVVKLSPSGTLDLYTSVDADVIVDVSAAFVTAAAPATAGRFVPVAPQRVVDTRATGQRGTTDLLVPLPADVPPDASALAVSVTVVDAADDGYLTVFPAQSARPDTSVVNADRLNRTRANAVFAPVGPGGMIVHRSMTTDVIVDVWGWFTGPSAPAAEEGLFVPQSPTRVWDSRHSLDPVHARGTVEQSIAPASAAAVVVNTTAVDTTGAGYLSVFAAGTARPEVSSLNYRWSQPVAALTVTRASSRGVGVYSYAGAHVLVDLAGWFTGPPATVVEPPGLNPSPAADTDVLFIADSSFSGIRWNGALDALQGADFDSRLESCRRLVSTSCRGREGYAPPTALQELSTVPVGRFRIAVIATGYNDWSGTFPTAFDAVMRQARSRGIERVVWLTYRENVGYVSPGAASNSATFAANNRVLSSAVASGDYPDLVIADWHTYSIGRRDWVAADGVHLTVSGARAAATYVSRTLAALERRPCPAGLGGLAAPGGWCADPDVTGPG